MMNKLWKPQATTREYLTRRHSDIIEAVKDDLQGGVLVEDAQARRWVVRLQGINGKGWRLGLAPYRWLGVDLWDDSEDDRRMIVNILADHVFQYGRYL